MLKKLFLALLIFNSAYIPTIHSTFDFKFLSYNSLGWRNSLFTVGALTAGICGWLMLKNSSTSNAGSKIPSLPIKINPTLSADSHSQIACTLTYDLNGEIIQKARHHNTDVVKIDLPNGIFALCKGSKKQRQDYTVCDQLNSHKIAEYTAKQLRAGLLKNNSQTIQQIFTDFHKKIAHCKKSTATALIAHIKNNTLTIAQLGNSCAFIFNNKQTLDVLIPILNTYGQPSEHEKKLGDKDFNVGRVCTLQKPLNDNDLIILVSDGANNHLSYLDIINVIQKTQRSPEKNIAQALVKKARRNALKLYGPAYTIDDQTAVVIRYSTK